MEELCYQQGSGQGLSRQQQQQLCFQMFSRAAANLVLAVLCIHCSNYIICGFNFESIFWSFYSNLMVHSHCRSPQPEYIPPSMAIVVIAEIIPINLCLKRN